MLVNPASILSQIVNGGFESSDQPTLIGWQISYQGQSFQDAPVNGGQWCLRLEAGNYQGYFPGIAYQIIPNIKNGDFVKISAWAKQELGTTDASLCLKILHAYDYSTIIAKDGIVLNRI